MAEYLTEFFHDLPEGLLDWVASLGPGVISRLERHVARREAWVVDVRRADDSVMQGFLRIDRNPHESSHVSLRREARICQALMAHPVPAPALLGWNEEHHAALFTRDAGSADLPAVEDKARQRAIMEDFIDTVARLHRLDTTALGLEDILGPLPSSPAECALGDLELQLSQFQGFLAGYTEPLITYGVDWLRRFVPETVARVSLVQGDTGPVNFMFQGDRVSALVDWEWGHWGDPMEDLGNICVREFWNPSGGLSGLFERYERQSGIPYTRFAAQYYRIQQNVRGMIPIHAACHYSARAESLAWYLCYRYVGDRSTCEALADAMDIAIDRPPVPEELPAGPLARAATKNLESDVLPRLDDEFARTRVRDIGIIVACMDRQARYGNELATIECREIGELLGQSHSDYPAALSALDAAIEAQALDDEPLIRYLARRAYRDEWLYAPAAYLYPGRHWSPLD